MVQYKNRRVQLYKKVIIPYKNIPRDTKIRFIVIMCHQNKLKFGVTKKIISFVSPVCRQQGVLYITRRARCVSQRALTLLTNCIRLLANKRGKYKKKNDSSNTYVFFARNCGMTLKHVANA